jgi:transcriptional regulator with XRE-family HTH domain
VQVSLVIRRRLKDLGLDQRDLAVAAQVTDSYVSQLLASKKAPPAPNRTDLYPRIEAFLQLPPGQLAKLAEIERLEERKKRVAEPPQPLFRQCRALIMQKCAPRSQPDVSAVLEREPFGVLERLVTQTFLDVAREVAARQKENEDWLRRVASREVVLQFLEADIFSVSVENGVALLTPLIEGWDIDLATFAMEVVLHEGMAEFRKKRFGFFESRADEMRRAEPGLEEFLRDKSLSGDPSEEEIEFLRTLRLRGRSPAPIYYYRELQNLRDPFHFRS